jgi:Uncharacterised nucleotidyltransferase
VARPRHIDAVVSALHFERPRPELLQQLSDAEWEKLLDYSDIARFTLVLRQNHRDRLPEWVKARVDRNLADNIERVTRTQWAYVEASEALRAVGARHLVLKGFAQWPYFLADVRLRLQADLDLYCPPDSIYPARDALFSIGYKFGRFPEVATCDHLPLLIRPGPRTWRGNPYDPEITPAIELHHQFWGRSYTRFGPRVLDAFWTRRCTRRIGLIQFDALDPLDAFAYASLHALRHLIYGGLSAIHIYEIGFFLQSSEANERLWTTWLHQHDKTIRRLTTVPAFLAAQWFGCRLPGAVEEEIGRLPTVVPRWLRTFGDSTLVDPFRFNKQALWLHLGLIESVRERFSILSRRLFPLWAPPLNSRWVQERDGEPWGTQPRPRFQKYTSYFNWFVTRVIRHLRVLPSTLWNGLRLWSS